MNGEQLTIIVTYAELIYCNAVKEQLKYMALLNNPIINPILTVFESNKYDLEIRHCSLPVLALFVQVRNCLAPGITTK